MDKKLMLITFFIASAILCRAQVSQPLRTFKQLYVMSAKMSGTESGLVFKLKTENCDVEVEVIFKDENYHDDDEVSLVRYVAPSVKFDYKLIGKLLEQNAPKSVWRKAWQRDSWYTKDWRLFGSFIYAGDKAALTVWQRDNPKD